MSLTPATPAGLQSGIPPLIALTMEAFMNMHLPERGFLLHPVIPAQGIVILFAPRGIGKNLYSLERSPCRSRRSNTVSLARPQSQTDAVCGRGDARSSHAGQTNFLG